VEFQAFVNSMELEDIPVLGRKFTWFHPNGRSMSRIYRIFLSDDWISQWGNPSLWILPRVVSDHCPLVLRYNSVDWGPRPFRFNNHWLLHKDFKSLVEEWWRSQSYSGWMGFVLKEKVNGLKGVIKAWGKEVYGAIDSKIRLLVEDIKDVDLKGELLGLSEEEVANKKLFFFELWHLLKSKESMIVQRGC
ncbi:putative transposon TX1 protein, partial [Trifolium medium]|nr:putative transposon TX1 protein [Trifolium medium]